MDQNSLGSIPVQPYALMVQDMKALVGLGKGPCKHLEKVKMSASLSWKKVYGSSTLGD